MGLPKLIGLITVIGFAAGQPGFQPNHYPQNQVNAWGQACRSFQQNALHTQAVQNQYFAQTFPQIGLPPLPFMDICSQIPSYGGGAGYGQGGAGASAGTFSTGGGLVGGFDNRFGGGNGGGVQGVSVSSGSFPGGQSGTSVTHFGPGGGTVSHYTPNGGGATFSTGNRFGGSGNGGGASFGSFGTSSGYGNGGGSTFSTFGTSSGNGGFATANRFGGSSVGGGASSFGSGTGGSFATANRFGGGPGGNNVYTAQGPNGAGVSVSSTNDGHGNVHTQVHKHQY